MNEDAPPGPAWAPARGATSRPRFDPSLYDPTFVPPPRTEAAVDFDRTPPAVPSPPAPMTGGVPESQNGMATASFILGLCSALAPVLAVPGVILGVVALGRTKRHLSLPGRERALAGIITSLILGSLSLAVLVVIAAGAS